MPNNILKTSVLTGVVLFGATGCDKLLAALEGGPQTSYCESLCDWAVACADGESSLTTEEMASRCEEQTNATDSECAEAEKGNLGPDEILILNECTDAVSEMECDQLTSAAGTPPLVTCVAGYGGVSDASSLDFSDPASIADVGAYATFNAARNAVLSTGAEMCDDITQELCSSFVACSPDYDSDAADELKEDAMDACLDSLSSFNSSCKSEGLYDQALPIDFNPTRYAANKCIETLAGSESICEPSSWTGIAECAGAFVSLDGVDLTGALLSGLDAYLGE